MAWKTGDGKVSLRNPNNGWDRWHSYTAGSTQLFPTARIIAANVPGAAAACAFKAAPAGFAEEAFASVGVCVRDKARSTMLSNMGIRESAGSG